MNGDLTCRGTIQNQPGNVYLRLYGNLYNYGTISAYYVYFMGGGNQYVYQDATAGPFANNTFGKPSSVDSGTLWMLSDLRFQNTIVDLYNRNIIMFDDDQSYDLELDGGQLYRLTLATDQFSNLTLSNDAYMWYVNAGSLILHGIIQSYGSVYFQNVVNLGTMRAWYGSQNFYVYGDLTNWGSISNGTAANTFIRVAGNFSNYGTVNCYQIGFNGTTDQYLRIGGSISPNRFTLFSQIGPATWYFNGSWQSEGSDYMDINPWDPGVWQPVGTIPGRLIILGCGADLGIPQNLTITETAGAIKLSWGQVPGAAYYIVQTAVQPEGPFTSLPDYAYDGDPSDGIVRLSLDPLPSPVFFRVRAAN